MAPRFVLSSTSRRGSISFVSTTNPAAHGTTRDKRVQRREAVAVVLGAGIQPDDEENEVVLHAAPTRTAAS